MLNSYAALPHTSNTNEVTPHAGTGGTTNDAPASVASSRSMSTCETDSHGGSVVGSAPVPTRTLQPCCGGGGAVRETVSVHLEHKHPECHSSRAHRSSRALRHHNSRGYTRRRAV